MKTIHKYAIEPGHPRLEVHLPGYATVVFVDSQLTGVVHFWVEFDPDAEMRKRVFVLHETGHDIPDDHYYVGSVLDPPNVWHLYEEYDIDKALTGEPVEIYDSLTPQAEAVFDPPGVVQLPKHF